MLLVSCPPHRRGMLVVDPQGKISFASGMLVWFRGESNVWRHEARDCCAPLRLPAVVGCAPGCIRVLDSLREIAATDAWTGSIATRSLFAFVHESYYTFLARKIFSKLESVCNNIIVSYRMNRKNKQLNSDSITTVVYIATVV